MIQIYFIKKNFDVQKAERWFKERHEVIQMIDLSRAKLGRRELQSVVDQVGLDALIDVTSRAWRECTARFSGDAERIMNALIENPRCLTLPIVRDGKRATVGYAPEIWTRWLEED